MEFPKITLKAARVNAGLTQKAAAAALGVNVSTLQNYETGATVPTWDMVQLIAKVYRFPKEFISFGIESA